MWTRVRANCKIEFGILLLGIVACAVGSRGGGVFDPARSYATPERVSAVVALFQTAVSVYLLVVTLIALTTSSMRRAILSRKLDRDLALVTGAGLFEALLVCLWGILVPMEVGIFSPVFWWLTLLALATFLKYAAAMLRVFKLSMDMMAHDLDDEKRDRRRLLNAVEKIAIHHSDKT